MWFIICFRSGTYEIQEADGVPIGTKIVVYLKGDSREFSDGDTVQSMYFLRFYEKHFRAKKF